MTIEDVIAWLGREERIWAECRRYDKAEQAKEAGRMLDGVTEARLLSDLRSERARVATTKGGGRCLTD